MPTVSRRNSALAHAGLFYAALVWGSTFFIVKLALAEIDPVIMVSYRFLLAGIILLVFLKLTGRQVMEKLGQGIWLAIILFLLYIPQTIGLKYTTASNSGFITGLFVAFVPVFLMSIFKRRPTIMEVIASVVSLLGLWILTGGLRDINNGDILTLAAAVTYALHILYSDKYVKAGADPYVLCCQQFLIVGLLSLLTGLVLDLPFTVGSASVWLIVVFLALIPTLSAFVIQLAAQKYTSPLRVSLVFALEPVFAALFAWTLGGEEIVSHRAFGGLLIFAALVISGLPTPGRSRKRGRSPVGS